MCVWGPAHTRIERRERVTTQRSARALPLFDQQSSLPFHSFLGFEDLDVVDPTAGGAAKSAADANDVS